MNNRRIRAAFIIATIALVIAFLALALTGAGIVAQIDFFEDDVFVAEQQGINIKGGVNIAVSAVDNPSENRVDYTIDGVGGSSGWQELARITATGGETTLTFTGISTNIDLMAIHAQGIGANIQAALRIFFNNDTATNYDSWQGSFHSYVGSANNGESGCRLGHGSAPFTSTPENGFTFSINQPDATLPKNSFGVGNIGNGSGTTAFSCRWENTSNKITEIDFTFEDARTFLADGVIILLGR